MRKVLFVVLLAAIVLAIGYAIWQSQDSAIPEDAKRAVNPVQPSEAALKSAERIYFDKCAECHGDNGKGDGRQASMYQPKPASFVDVQHMRLFTDGELFYRISQGKRPMPAYKRKLTEEQRWELVLLVRAFAKSAAPSK